LVVVVVVVVVVVFQASKAAHYNVHCISLVKKGKAVPLQACSGPEGSRKLRLPDFVTTAQDGGKIVSLTHRPLFAPRKYSQNSFLLDAESTAGPYYDRKDYVNEKFQ
jgi:hypothetical protein